MKILLLTHHTMYAPNRAGFHHLAESFRRLGHDVVFCSTPFYVSLAGLVKFCIWNRSQRSKAIKTFRSGWSPAVIDGIVQTAWISLAYPIRSIPSLGPVLKRLYLFGFCGAFRRRSFELIVFESEQGLLLWDKLKRRFPGAAFVYRVSDDLAMMQAPREVLIQEQRLLSSFDLVSSPSTYISKRLKESSPGLPVVDMPHGIDKKLFDTCTEDSPYKNSPNAVFIGVNYLDWRFIGIVSAARPNVTFHIIGNPPGGISRSNVVCHGLIPFRETIRYLLNADIGLMTLLYRPGIEVFERTLKFIQYTYCRLPIVAPSYLGLEYPHLFAYKDAEESMISAFDQALQYDGDTIDRSWVRDWNEIAEDLIREGCGKGKRGSA